MSIIRFFYRWVMLGPLWSFLAMMVNNLVVYLRFGMLLSDNLILFVTLLLFLIIFSILYLLRIVLTL